MSSAKIVFSLSYMGMWGRAPWYHFQLYHVDPRFLTPDTPQRYSSANGWTIRGGGTPEISFQSKTMYLGGSETGRVDYGRVLEAQPRISSTGGIVYQSPAELDAEARRLLTEAVEALDDWAQHCPSFAIAPVDTSISPEVRQSLLELIEDEEGEGPAPIFIEEWQPQKIAIS